MKQRIATRADKEALTRFFRKTPTADIPKQFHGFPTNVYTTCLAFADRAELRPASPVIFVEANAHEWCAPQSITPKDIAETRYECSVNHPAE